MTVSLNKTLSSFSAEMTGDKTFNLADYAGKNIVLYFYPKDNTPGCTTESIAFRDLHAEFEAAGAKIFGLSRDSIRSHDGFKNKLEDYKLHKATSNNWSAATSVGGAISSEA